MIIWHNPRCSKSRQTLKLIEESGCAFEQRLYLQEPPSVKEIQSVLKQLGLNARDILRKSEEAYKNLGLKDTTISEKALIQFMQSHPQLIERPIVIKGNKAVIGRPPESVEVLLN